MQKCKYAILFELGFFSFYYLLSIKEKNKLTFYDVFTYIAFNYWFMYQCIMHYCILGIGFENVIMTLQSASVDKILQITLGPTLKLQFFFKIII